MPPPKEAYHHGDLRNALVEAAAKLIEAGGSDAFSLREAARAVGVSANAAYRHFEDKSALLTAVAASGYSLLSNRMQAATAAVRDAGDAVTGAVDRFKAVGRAYVELACERPQMFRLMYGADGRSCLKDESHDFAGPTPSEVLGQVLDELVAAGCLSPPRRGGAELQAWAVVHGFASLAIDGTASLENKRERARALEALLDFIVAGLCDRRPGRPRARAVAPTESSARRRR